MKQAQEYCILCETGGKEPLIEKASWKTRGYKSCGLNLFARLISRLYSGHNVAVISLPDENL
jgi:hypothetical protein